MGQLRNLLANKVLPRHGASSDDLMKARKLLKAIAVVIESGDAAAWRRLSIAYDVVDVGGSLTDLEPEYDGDVDSTMPAAQFHPSSAPPTRLSEHSVDETVALGEFHALDIDDDDFDPRAPAGSTLMTGTLPKSVQHKGDSRTVPIPVHMPAGVTASGVPSGPAISSGMQSSSTVPMTRVPSSVLDVEKYAVLRAWTQVHPERREQLHQQYGLSSEDERQQLDARFEALFARNLQLRSAFEKRLKMHLGFLQRAPQ